MASRFIFAESAASTRRASEDRAEVLEYGDALVLVVADGAGGMHGGAAASDAAVSAVREHVAETDFDAYDVRAWSDVFRSTDARLAKRLAGETTAIVVVIGAGGIMGVSAGDSEAWMVSPAGVDRLTESQTRRRLGNGSATATPFHRPRLEGMLVVATDGLFKLAAADAIVACCVGRSVYEAAARLIELPRLSSGAYPDDVAVVVVATTPSGTAP